MSKVLLVNPSSRKSVYLDTNVKVGAPSYPNLTLATLAGWLVKDHEVKIIDLDLEPEEALFDLITRFKPDLVATSAKTPVYPGIKSFMSKIKVDYPNITTVIGGVHVTAMPEEAIRDGCFDIIVRGEGDSVLPEILSGKLLAEIAGIIYKNPETYKYEVNPAREQLLDLNSLPYPAWSLFDLSKYKNSRLSSRKNPVGHLETSRGCAYRCNFCSKLTFGTNHRVKSPTRVVDEMEYMLSCGFKEIHIADDSFTQDIARAKVVCAEIIRRGLHFPWSLINGVRVNLVDLEFFKLAHTAGLWQVGFGIESGDQAVLEAINKKTNLDQVRKAVAAAEAAGVATFGFFIFGLKGETESSMQKTIDFAKSLPLSTAKFDLCIPYPGTDYYQELLSEGRMLSYDWSDFIVHQVDRPLFKHPNLELPTISKYYHQAFRAFYLRPKYIIRRFLRDLKSGDLFYDAIYFLNSKWY